MVGRANGRMGFLPFNGQNAARRVVAMPEDGRRRPPHVCVGQARPRHPRRLRHEAAARQLTHLAATHFDGTKSLCRQDWDTIAGGIAYPDLLEPRLAVCEQSWGACSLFSKLSNNRAEHRTKSIAVRAAAAQTQRSGPKTVVKSTSAFGCFGTNR